MQHKGSLSENFQLHFWHRWNLSRPCKVSTIHVIKVPEISWQLREFIGMTTYLGPFIANLSAHIALLHKLLKRDHNTTLNNIYDIAFQSWNPVSVMTLLSNTCHHMHSDKICYMCAQCWGVPYICIVMRLCLTMMMTPDVLFSMSLLQVHDN